MTIPLAPQPVERTLQRVVVAYRVVGALWLTALALLTLAGGVARPRVVVGTIVLALGWAGLTVAVSARRPEALRTWWWVVTDLAVAMATLLAPNAAGLRSNFFGGYPMSSVFVGAFGRGFAGGLVTAVLLAATAVIRYGSGVPIPAPDLASITAIYLAAGVLSPWAIDLIVRHERRRQQTEEALDRERAERVRAEERAELAAHLHDSVLQTLALIQRRSDPTSEAARLARRQEGELRRWLYGAESDQRPARLGATLRRVCQEVEEAYRVRIDLVTVGDTEVTEPLTALAGAVREALTNAAKFSVADQISVFVEVTPEEVTAFVRDRGVGFDPAGVPQDRRGIRDSIRSRVARHGGRAEIRSAPGEGTEVELGVPVGSG